MGEATRVAFGKSIAQLGAYYKDVVVLEADLGKSTNSFRFKERYPKRYFQMGIAEANMIGTAAGLALCGKIPFICSFSCFITGRYDIIRISIAYSKANVKIVGTHSGIAAGEDGNSQQGLEDISLMRSLPGMVVLQPCDFIEAQKMVEYSVCYKGPMYLRLTRQKMKKIHSDNYQFNFGKAEILKKGKDVTIIASGGTVYNALQATIKLEEINIFASLINIHTLKPIDKKTIIEFVRNTQKVLTIEDHNIIGGLGSAVSELLSEECPTLLKRIGLNDCFGESGKMNELYEKHNLNIEGIVREVIKFLKK